MEYIGVYITIGGVLVAMLTFLIGRQTAAKLDGKEQGKISTDLEYIKDSVNRIDKSLTDNVKRLEGRIDEQSAIAISISQLAGRADEKAASAHKRIDEHLEREHHMTVSKR